MKTMFLAVAVVAALAPSPARANADAELLKTLGFAGRWAYVCDKPSSDDNAYLIYETNADGKPVEHLVMGDYERADVLSNIVRLPDGKVRWSQTGDGDVLVIVNLIEPTRLKTWSSVDGKGTVLIRDGRFVPEGAEAPWFYRCPAR